MKTYLAAYFSSLIVMVGLDMLWLGVIAKPFYQQAIGHLMAETPNAAVAALFYALYALGLLIFVLQPLAESPGLGRALVMGALFGFFAYATYDLTNLATLRDWPIGITLLDLAWGSFVSGISVVAGKWVMDRL